MKKIKISFVGVGFLSQIAHLIHYYKNPNVELFEVCDLDLDLASKIKKKFKFTGGVFNDYKKMSVNKTDGVVVITQRRLMPKIVEYFLRSGCNVFSEKPHCYSSKEYSSIVNNKKPLWIKGYTRRFDRSVNFLKKDLNFFSNKFGDLLTIKYESSSGNAYLGSKHIIYPTIKKEIRSQLSLIPKFIPKKYEKLYDNYINTVSHPLDLFDYLNIYNFKKIKSFISENYFSSNFIAEHKFNKNKEILCQVFLSSSPNNYWDEKLTLYFHKGQINIFFNPVMYKKMSHKLVIFDKINNKTQTVQYKNSWSFFNQANYFIDLIVKIEKRIKLSLEDKKNCLDGKTSIQLYEKIWRSYLNSI